VSGTGFDIDERLTRVQVERVAKRLSKHAGDVLLDQQQTLKDRILARAPQGPTGNLRANVYVEVVESNRGPILKGGVRGVPYSVKVEFGTRYMSPEPFLRPAIAEMPGYIRRRRKGAR
jgi:HK97 gp10 family phage protein